VRLLGALLTLILSLGAPQIAAADFRVAAGPQGTLVIGSGVNPRDRAYEVPFPDLMRQVEQHIQEKIASQMPGPRLGGRVSLDRTPDSLRIELHAAYGRPGSAARGSGSPSPFQRMTEIVAAELGRLPRELVTIQVQHLVRGGGDRTQVQAAASSRRYLARPELARLIREQATRYGVPPALVQAVICCESNFDPQAVSPKGAQGLMQLMPGTSRLMRVKNPFNVGENIAGGTAYLRLCLDQFHQDLRLALAAYNAGPGQVTKYGTIPPFQETRLFVRRVLAEYTRLSQGKLGPGGSDFKAAAPTLQRYLNTSPTASCPQLRPESRLTAMIINIRPRIKIKK